MSAWKEEVLRGAMYTLGAITTLAAVGMVMRFTTQSKVTETKPLTAGAFGIPAVAGAFPFVGAPMAVDRHPRMGGIQGIRAPSNWGAW